MGVRKLVAAPWTKITLQCGSFVILNINFNYVGNDVSPSIQFHFYYYSEEKEEIQQAPKAELPSQSASNRSTSNTPQLLAPTAVPEVDEDGYCIKPKEPQWESQVEKKGKLTCSINTYCALNGEFIINLFRFAEGFYSDSDSDSDNDERERKIHVEIKPLNNGTAPISASVDELRATVENLSLSPLGGALSV